MDLAQVLQRSKAVMNKTKDLPYGNHVKNAGGKIDKDTMEVQFESRQSNGEPRFSETAAQRSKMPKEVIEAIRNSSTKSASCLDSVLTEQMIKDSGLQKTKQTAVTEQAIQTTQQIDYSLIRMMIEESMKKYIGSLKKSLISESKGSGLQMMTQKGNTFKFVTEDGKIFEGKLIYKGNLND